MTETTDHSLNFSAYEWEQLCEAPVLAGLTVIQADPSGWLGSREEMRTLTSSFRITPDEHPLVAEVKRSIVAQDLIGPDRETPFDELLARTLRTLEGVHQSLRNRVSEEAQLAFLQFLARVMTRVAGAAREGGFLNPEPENISNQERQTIATLLEGLGMELEDVKA